MHPMLNIAVRAALAAGKTIIRNIEKVDSFSVNSKRQNDFVTEIDIKAEREIISMLQRSYPNHGIIAEETGHQEGDDYTWIIDPLDGTTNFIHGFPHFAVSIALVHKKRVEQAVIYNPISQELFTASRGEGAWLNNKRLRVSQRRSLDGALLGTGFPFLQDHNYDLYMKTLQAFMEKTAGIRRPGAASLDLAYVAAGRMDGFWEMDLKPWDIAAGALLVREAGGLVGEFDGGSEWLKTGNIVAASPKVYHNMLQVLAPISQKL